MKENGRKRRAPLRPNSVSSEWIGISEDVRTNSKFFQVKKVGTNDRFKSKELIIESFHPPLALEMY